MQAVAAAELKSQAEPKPYFPTELMAETDAQVDYNSLIGDLAGTLSRPIVQSHTYEHQWARNLIMYLFIGVTLLNCSFWGMFYTIVFDI